MPPELSNKIAAGEVIQRPASVAKELLDNAVDAGADRIKLIVQQAGRTLIQVIDNGCGMSAADARLCFERHATSKIQSVEDLFRIRTMGFRGEAMASIASISQVEMKTKRVDDESGILLEIWGGEEKRFEPVATDDGTSVAIRNLFYNVPARRQFLKTDATELKHIIRVFQNIVLANTDIEFELHADGDRIYHLPKQELKQRVADIFGKQYRASLIPFNEETSYVKIHGLLADPKLAKKSRGEQFLFVNGRPFQHRYLSYVILSLFDAWTKQNEYPFYAIFLEIDPAQVDVNVHPAKMEVKFDDERSITQLARSVVKKALNEHFVVPDVGKSDFMENDFDLSFDQIGQRDNTGSQQFQQRGRPSEPVQFPSRINFGQSSGRDGNETARQLYGEAEQNEDSVGGGKESAKKSSSGDKTFWQLHNRYILTQTRTGLTVIDQHAAHKRIIYENTLSATEESLPFTQQLLFARTIELSASEFSLLEELLPIIQRMGFSIDLLSGNTAIINGVPADIDIGDERQVLRDMLHQYRDLDKTLKLEAREKVAIAFASRTAIPRGKRLTEQEMELLIDQLFACEEPYKDPLQHPTLMYMSMEEIMRRFR
ncbi:DNA mismatch repair endonuclease MutL [Rhodohalobacter barkolensis]|uniref:DNA mismatch repair protein MutL n=1 Tax=Rhodohalobacter barkolensis TaxID=2053187 RepID=A0A2N0VL83_9BACT|nr:DNA mismatch repair endonuclease MutL [Rhodohalobacter barkolensis]PKD44940.1 DNA mismatch repair protein MutL [Rhodohalobacter barkolensis]